MSNRVSKSTYIGKRNTIGFFQGFGRVEDMPKGERESSLLLEVLITRSESPSRIKDKQPIFSAKEIARGTVNASTKSKEKGRGTYSDTNTNAWPWLSRTTTTRPALPKSLKVTPSKLTFR